MRLVSDSEVAGLMQMLCAGATQQYPSGWRFMCTVDLVNYFISFLPHVSRLIPLKTKLHFFKIKVKKNKGGLKWSPVYSCDKNDV